MKKILLCAGLLASLTVSAQTKDGGITKQMLQQIEKQNVPTASDRALRNALAANAIDALAKNQQNAGALDTYFNIETKKQSITNQKSSGRCWMFSGMNVLRANFAKRTDSLKVTFSQDYLFLYDQLEKANLMLQGVIDTGKKPIDDQRVQFFFHHPLNDGGTFCGVADLTEKYGLVPTEVQPETYSAESTSRMSRIISSKLREQGLELRKMVNEGKKAKDIQQRKTEMLSEIYHMLVITLGEPVKEFTYAFRDKNGKALTPVKTYTPQSFYQEVVGEKLNGTFIMVMNDPRREYYKTYEVEYDRHTYDGHNWKYLNLPMEDIEQLAIASLNHNWKYLNLPMEDIEQLAIASLKDGRKLYSSYDVGKQLDRKRGFADTENYDYESLFGTTFGMNKAERISTFDSGSTHASDSGHQGCIIMTARWFREYMFRLVVDKKYVSEKLLKDYDQKPIMVMPEDPLFQMDE